MIDSIAMKKFLLIAAVLMLSVDCGASADVLGGLLERIDAGLSDKMIVEVVPDTLEWFEITQRGDRPAVRGSSIVNAAAGINHYLKYVAGVHLAWNNMEASLPEVLPAVADTIRMTTPMRLRYYLNYCTYSYSMPFWDRARWQREIDWMAIHGINMPLAAGGCGSLWRNVLRRLGYPEQKIDGFIAGPAFQAWWLMNNLEGWGGPNTDEYYRREEQLQKDVLGMMRDFGMMPVMSGYSGMLPHDARSELGVPAADPGKWLGYQRPAFIVPSDSAFSRVAQVYYSVLDSLYGRAPFYSIDPFHEGGNTSNVDLPLAGRKIVEEMRRSNPEAVWVVQGWQENPRREMIEGLPAGSLLILDLQSENSPTWSRPDSQFGDHGWLFCMLHNFGGNIGLYGKMEALTGEFDKARRLSPSLAGVGLTMEGIETNPALYELFCEMPWRAETIDPQQWIDGYVKARYGSFNRAASLAWHLLVASVYNSPADSLQQGTTESVFCARPSDFPRDVSTWADSKKYYDGRDVIEAARLMVAATDSLASSPNFRYDLVDIVRQAVAERGREVAAEFGEASAAGDSCAYRRAASRFIRLMEFQDTLLATMPDFRLGRWTESARSCGGSQAEKERWEENARRLITTWGHREAADGGGLRDYGHREWQGLISDFYIPRWKAWFDARLSSWGTGKMPEIDFFGMEDRWVREAGRYSAVPQGDPVATARRVLSECLK